MSTLTRPVAGKKEQPNALRVIALGAQGIAALVAGLEAIAPLAANRMMNATTAFSLILFLLIASLLLTWVAARRAQPSLSADDIPNISPTRERRPDQGNKGGATTSPNAAANPNVARQRGEKLDL